MRMTEERLSSAKHQLRNGEREKGKAEILGKRKNIYISEEIAQERWCDQEAVLRK